jgi:hypothetical protein
MSENPCCIGVIPYENDDEDTKSLTMCFYVDSDGNGIPTNIKEAATEMFSDYEIVWKDLQQDCPSAIVTELLSFEKQKEEELSNLSGRIKKNLRLFNNRLNVTAVCASYKITNFKQENTPCVTVFVLEKGKVPAGETEIKRINELNDYPFDVVEGYYKPAMGSELKDYAFPVRGGVGIGAEGEKSAGTLGGFLNDEQGNCYILSCEHVLNTLEVKKNNPHENENPNNPPKVVHGAGNVIEHPAQVDYKEMFETAKSNLKHYKDSKSNFEKRYRERGEQMTPEHFKKLMEGHENNITDAQKTYEDTKTPCLFGRYGRYVGRNWKIRRRFATYRKWRLRRRSYCQAEQERVQTYKGQ